MSAPPRRLDAAELLHGSDHEFITNMYLAALRRWPDAAGYRRFMALVANRPERRMDALREVAGSEEARRLGALVTVPEVALPGDPNLARDAMMDVRTEVLQGEISGLREAVALLSGVGGAEVAGLQRELAEARDAELRGEISALRRELAPVQAGVPPAPEPGLESLALGLARLIDAQITARLGTLEARLCRVEARLAPASQGATPLDDAPLDAAPAGATGVAPPAHGEPSLAEAPVGVAPAGATREPPG